METETQLDDQATSTMDLEELSDRLEEKNRGIKTPIRLTIKQRLVLLVMGRVFLSYERRPGWIGSLPIYAFKCPHHGTQVDYPHGNYDRLDCPLCRYSIFEYPPETSL